MKKKIISAILAFSMIFSILPSTISYAYSSYGVEADGSISKNACISELTVHYTNGVIDKISEKPNPDQKSNAHQGGPATVGVTIVSDVDIWYDAGDGATLQNDSNSFTASSTYVGNVVPSFEGSFLPAMRVKANAVPNSAEEHVIYDASTGSVDVTNAANGGADIFTKDSVNSVLEAAGNTLDPTKVDGENLFDIYKDQDLTEQYTNDNFPFDTYKVKIYVSMDNPGTEYMFEAEAEVKIDGTGEIKIPSGGDTPSEDTAIPSVALTVTAPTIGATPATTATTTTTGVVANPAVTWDPADSTFAKNQAYKASVTLSADSGYKFTDSTTATINGKTATVTLNGDGTLKAEYTFDAIKLTGISSNKTGLTSSFAPNDSYTP